MRGLSQIRWRESRDLQRGTLREKELDQKEKERVEEKVTDDKMVEEDMVVEENKMVEDEERVVFPQFHPKQLAHQRCDNTNSFIHKTNWSK